MFLHHSSVRIGIACLMLIGTSLNCQVSGQDASPRAMPLVKISRHSDLGSLESWTDDSILLVVPDGGRGRSSTEIVSAKTVQYRFGPGKEALLSLVAYSANAVSYLVFGRKLFYVFDGIDLITGLISSPQLVLIPSVFRIDTPPEGPARVISRLAETANEKPLVETLLHAQEIRIDLSTGVPFQFWNAGSSLSSQPASPELTAVRLLNDTLQLECASPKNRFHATFWIDLKSKRLLRTVVDGKEVFTSQR